MKPSINKFFAVLACACALAACSKEPSVPSDNAAALAETPAPQAPAQPPAASAPAERKNAPAQEKKPVPSVKQTPAYTAAQLAEGLKRWDKKLSTLQTSFQQTTSYDGVLVSRSRGVLFYDRARNVLRLDSSAADGAVEQSAVTDKKDIVILDGEGQHVTTLAWADWQQGQPNRALFDFGNYTALLDEHAAAVKSQNGREAVLELTPREGEEYKLYLTVSKDDFFPSVIAVESDLMLTRAELSGARKNEPLAADTFGGFFK